MIQPVDKHRPIAEPSELIVVGQRSQRVLRLFLITDIKATGQTQQLIVKLRQGGTEIHPPGLAPARGDRVFLVHGLVQHQWRRQHLPGQAVERLAEHLLKCHAL